jgi:hypothetical protein
LLALTLLCVLVLRFNIAFVFEQSSNLRINGRYQYLPKDETSGSLVVGLGINMIASVLESVAGTKYEVVGPNRINLIKLLMDEARANTLFKDN